MRIEYQLYGRCFWHADCEKSRSGVMKEVRLEPDFSVIECLHCGKSGEYPVGGVGEMEVKEVQEATDDQG